MPDVITDNIDLWTSALLTKSTAGRGNNGKLEAYGIKKLRELILATALRGLFEEENESLPHTIEQDMTKAKKEYFKSIGKRPKEYDFGPALLDEFSLPAGWLWKRVGELCDLQTGATPSTNKPEYFGGEIRWLVSGDINQGIIEDCDGRISEEGMANSNCKILPINTVLIALNGQGKTRASVALLKVAATCNQSLVGIIPFDTNILNPMFLLLSLRYRYYEIRDITGQNQRRGLNMGLVSELSIPLPPLAKQHRIVAKVDELLALCDQLEQQQTNNIDAHQTLVETLLGTLTTVESQVEFADAWTRIANHFDTLFTTEHSINQLKQTILQLAVMGKLVPQDTNYEPASALLEKISDEKKRLIKEGKIKNQNPLLQINDDEKPFQLPSDWAWVRLQDVIDVRDGTHDSPKDAFGEDTYPLVTSKNFINGEIDFEGARRISSEDHFEISKRSLVEKDDILFSMIGGNLGNQVMVKDDRQFSVKNVALFKYYNKVLTPPYFIKKYMEHLALNLQEKSSGGAQPFVSLGFLRNLVFALPPIEEQQRIVAKVDELMALCDTLKTRLTDAQITQLQLADTIVEQAVA